ncbi:unnamed protein product, partial [Heterobilharzia americana]
MVVESDDSGFRQLEYYSLVSKVCTELTNHLGLDDKALAEFVIHLAKKNPTFEKFKNALEKKGAEFTDPLIASILRLVEKMLPKKEKVTKKKTLKPTNKMDSEQDAVKNKLELRKRLLPALCMPDEDPNDEKRLDVGSENVEPCYTTDKKGEVEDKFIHPDELENKPYHNDTTTNNNNDNSTNTGSSGDDVEAIAMIKDLELLLSDAKVASLSESKSHDEKKSGNRRGRRSRSHSKSPHRSRHSDRRSYHRNSDSFGDYRGHRKHSRSPHGKQSRSPSPHSRRRSKDRSPANRSSYRRSRQRADRTPPRKVSGGSNSPTSSENKRLNDLPMEPSIGDIYRGRVTNVLAFGAVVQLDGLRKRWEGLVHVSQLRREGRVANVGDVVNRGQKVWVKVISFTGTRTGLSMREVDQETGADLNPSNISEKKPSYSSESSSKDKLRLVDEENIDGVRNPDRPATNPGSGLFGSRRRDVGFEEDIESGPKRKVQRISSPERWELKQMMSAGVIEKTELPDFDEETGLLPRDEEESDEDIEIELVEEEPPFLKGHGRHAMDLSPVRIVKNPDGSLQQAAMMRQALQKERREMKQQERQSQVTAEREAAPERMGKDWHDPMGFTLEN